MRAGDQGVEVVDRDPRVLRLSAHSDRDDLLGEHVERVAGHDGGLDQAFVHALRDDGALEQVAAELGEDAPDADFVDAVSRAPDPLQAAGDGLGRLDLQHEVDGAHVDAELERAGGDAARHLPGLQQLLDLGALLTRERAVMRPRDLLVGQLVQAQRDALGRAAVVDEHDRGVVGTDELEKLGVAGRPDRPTRRLAAAERLQRIGRGRRRFAAGEPARPAGLGHRRDGHLDAQVELLARARVDDRDLAVRPDEEAPDLIERALRGAQPDPLHRPARLSLQPLEREREMRAALGVGDGVDLVDDHRVDAAEHRPSLRGEDQVQRLRRGDEDVGRLARHRGALALGRVAGADGYAHILCADPAQRRAQVALDVVGEGLQRADVDDASAARAVGPVAVGLAAVGPTAIGSATVAQPVERPQERGERLAGPGGRGHEHVLAGGDRRPRLCLRGRGSGECLLEPGAGARAEAGERHRTRG